MNLPLLQSGVQAGVDFNPSTMPLENLIVSYVTILLGLFMIGFFAAKFIKKIGRLEMRGKEEPVQNSREANIIDTTQHNLDIEIFGKDSELIKSIFALIKKLEVRLANMYTDYNICSQTIGCLISRVCRTLERSAINNHFTTVLMPENVDAYINNMMSDIENEYRSVYNSIPKVSCINEDKMPLWDDIKEKKKKFVLELITLYKLETSKICGGKITIYQRYEPQFAGDDYHSGVLIKMISKNNRYIERLDPHGKGFDGLEELK